MGQGEFYQHLVRGAGRQFLVLVTVASRNAQLPFDKVASLAVLAVDNLPTAGLILTAVSLEVVRRIRVAVFQRVGRSLLVKIMYHLSV